MKIEHELKKYYQKKIYKNGEVFIMEKKKQKLMWGISGAGGRLLRDRLFRVLLPLACRQ